MPEPMFRKLWANMHADAAWLAEWTTTQLDDILVATMFGEATYQEVLSMFRAKALVA